MQPSFRQLDGTEAEEERFWLRKWKMGFLETSLAFHPIISWCLLSINHYKNTATLPSPTLRKAGILKWKL